MNQKNPSKTEFAHVPAPLKAGLCAAMLAYMAAWSMHLYTGTAALRGFFGDGAPFFLLYLSHSYLFNHPGHLVHLFQVGLPRDFQILLNALGLQAALWLGLRDPNTFKYIFVFWQFALPGFLYLALFAALWRKKRAVWIIFPLVSWAILSVPVDWSAPNSTRWAMPIFWMHFMLMIFAGPKIRALPATAALLLGAAMLGGLYEIVALYCVLCMMLGALFWWRQGNRVPFFYALAALPGACRALLTYITSGHNAPNSFHNLYLPQTFFDSSYSMLIGLTLILIAALGTGKISARYAFVPLLLILVPAVQTLVNALPDIWVLIEMRFDYVFLSLALMGWAGLLGMQNATPVKFALPAALLALVAGTVLWIAQIQGTEWWQSCRAGFTEQMRGTTLGIDEHYRPLFGKDRLTVSLPYRACLWDWSEPAASLLLAENGKVENWPILTFWQNFSFIKKDGAIYLHTGNWGASMPDLPLKTPLYDLESLYQKTGDGSLATRIRCMPAESASNYWRDNLMTMNDTQRAEMFVCPRNE